MTARDARSALDPAAVRPDVTIRPEAAGDADAVRAVVDAAFAP